MTKRYPVLLLSIILGLFMWSCSDPEEDDTTAPGAPQNLVSDPNQSVDGKASISWEAPADDDVVIYRIYRDADTGNFYEIGSGSTLFYSEEGLDYDVAYSYKVTAEDDSGNESAFSNTIIVTPYNQFSPEPPAGLEIKAHNIEADLEVNVELTWTANTESDFSYYKIYKSSTSPSFLPDAESYLDSVTSIYYLDEDVTPGNTYHYRLIAYDLGGFDSDPTIVVSDTPLEVPALTSPSDLAESISLTPTFEWTNVNMAVKYKIVVRTSSQSGDIWESDLTTNTANTMSIVYPTNAATALEANTRYFWFVAGYSQDTDEINVYSATHSFRTL
ncbi:MAG: hypothetical protein L3J79_12455 [Candidatus Marinimicrobia bacterium]|nr:hypothetical protein [Candidatus Neomarinimicrobiota bacterium]